MSGKELIRNLIICFCAGIAVLLGLFLLLKGKSTNLGVSQPIVTPTPSPTPEPQPEIVEILPTPAPLVVPYVVELPDTAVDVIVNGRTLFAVEDENTARQVLGDYMLHCSAVGEGQILIRCYAENAPILRKATGAGELLPYNSALAKLISNPALFPINKVVTTCEQSFSEVVTETQQNAQLPVGTRFIVTEGASEKWVIYYESVYKSGVECQMNEANRFKIGDSKSRIVQDGTYSAESSKNSKDEGQKGPSLATLRFTAPVKGKVASFFGLHDGVMNNGIDFSVESGAHISAPEDGVVIFCGVRGDYGFVVDILHDEGGAVSRLTGLTNVKVELYQRVRKSEQIGDLAPTEKNEKPLFHYELIINGIPYNPLQYKIGS